MATRIDNVNRAFALLIGIDDYSAYDASAGNPAGTSDLPASKNDVGSCYRICRALGIPPENIHVLTTPALGPEDFGEPGKAMKPGYAGAATRAEIEAQVAWLAGVLEHAPGDTDAPVGLLTYSGHGDFVDGFLALCPSDVRKGGAAATGDLDGALGFPRLQAIVAGKRGAAESLTVVIDCCHAAAAAAPGKPARRGARRSLTGRARAATGPVTAVGDRMILAAAPGQTAYQSTFDGRPHGALTWALSVVTDQWMVMAEGDVDRFTITHGDLRDRAQRLLGALDISQQLALYPEEIAPIPFFHRGASSAADVVASAPDRARHGIQLDPNELLGYTLYAWTIRYKRDGDDYHHTALVLSAGSDSPASPGWGYVGGQEYWQVDAHFANAFAYERDPDRTLTIAVTSQAKWSDTKNDPLAGGSRLPTEAAKVGWGARAPGGGVWLYSPSNPAAGISIALSNSNELTVGWCLLAATEPSTGTYVVSAATLPTFGAALPVAPAGQSWFYAT